MPFVRHPARGLSSRETKEKEETMNTLATGIRAVAAAALAALPLLAAAQSDYPNRPVKVLVPYAPGGATDIIARHVAAKLNDVLGQSVVVENRAGASGNVALDAAARSPADGYTLLCGNVSTNAINETTFAQTLQSKPSRDLTGITKLVEIPHVIVATPSLPVGSVAELVAYAKQNPGKLNYASAGLGTYPHLDMVVLEKTAGIVLTHVPYKGGAGQMLPSLMSGETQVAFINLASSLPQVRAGKLKAIATTAPARLRRPDVPTIGAGLSRNRHERLAGSVRPRRDAEAGHRQALCVGREGAVAARDEGDAGEADDDGLAVGVAGRVQRAGSERDGRVGEGGAGEQSQDRLTARPPWRRARPLSQPRYDLAIEKDLAIPVRDAPGCGRSLRPKSAAGSR
jgi:tripartite-type tricarboxylate transporter receptor subunit TctC